jgi:hypothetical protein
MNLRIENDEGKAMLKISGHKSVVDKLVLKVPAGCEVLQKWVGTFCAEFGITILGGSWSGHSYWMQEVDRVQTMEAVAKLLAGKALPPVEYPIAPEVPAAVATASNENSEEDEGGTSLFS